MKAAVIVFPGSNCDRDVQVALRQATGREPVMVWHKDADFEPVDLMVLPGGFSYGDYLRCGAMAAHSPVMRELVARAGRGVPLLGICNGFQMLTETGLLPGALLRNATLKFVCRDVLLRVETSQTLFTSRYETGQVIRIPVAHGDGNYFADGDTLARLTDRDQIAFRYCDEFGEPTPEANPNGSLRNIAGVYNEAKTILGLMPHPERLADPALGGCDGAPLFQGLVEALS
ncbi:MAG: phosphoribosylformylglycinamidine synthase subunit PurQ [Kiloniellales bacterium]|nr:phosphoribosylformylglycinamidine synthase subunit PurQ [Kiloniellales bacterium]